MKTTILLMITVGFLCCPIYGQETEPPPEPTEEQPEVLTSGPVHEAFAEPVDLNNQPGIISPAQPPSDITENPPAEKPAGQYVWVPGYWGWDSTRNSYIWVSGCWRIAPPKMSWVPGYWAQVPGGWQWVPGFWTPISQVGQIEYLPAPPELVNVEPPTTAVSVEQIWVPPCWYWYRGQYILRRGYWLTPQPDWVWVPTHYVWTPRGYVFVTGHWDYDLVRRGVLFAPVYFPRHFHNRLGFSYSLSVVVDIGNLQFGLFTYPRYCHYYFGDYYDDVYLSIGIFPWFECVSHRGWYDPIYMHSHWRHHRSDPQWDQHLHNDYDRRRADKSLRPARTYHEMEKRISTLPEPERNNFRMAKPFNRVVAENKNTMKFEPINKRAQQNQTNKTNEALNFRRQRSQWEQPSREPPARTPVGIKGPSKSPTREVTPPTEQRQRPVPSNEQQGKSSLPVENRVVTPPAEQKIPSNRRQETTSPPVERRVTAPQEKRPNVPERIKTPPPPISDKQGITGILRKGPPSQPAGEQRANGKSQSQIDSRQNRENRRNESQRGRNN